MNGDDFSLVLNVEDVRRDIDRDFKARAVQEIHSDAFEWFYRTGSSLMSE